MNDLIKIIERREEEFEGRDYEFIHGMQYLELKSRGRETSIAVIKGVVDKVKKMQIEIGKDNVCDYCADFIDNGDCNCEHWNDALESVEHFLQRALNHLTK